MLQVPPRDLLAEMRADKRREAVLGIEAPDDPVLAMAVTMANSRAA